jgi:hypothetical protein
MSDITDELLQRPAPTAPILQCALGSRVVQEVHGPRDLDPARLSVLGTVLASCVSGYKFTKSDDPAQEEKDRNFHSTVVNAVSKALSDLPTIGETVLLGAIQGPSGQHLEAADGQHDDDEERRRCDGMVTLQKRCQALAPSMRAAS